MYFIRAPAKDRRMRFTLFILLAGLVIAFLVYVISGGHIVFLPLLFLLPLGFFVGRRRRL